MARLELSFLGPPQVTLDGHPVKIDRRKTLALLAYLAVTGRSTPREFLATLFWDGYDTASMLAYLRRALWDIGQAIGKGWVLAEREAVTLSAQEGLWLDVAELHHTAGGLVVGRQSVELDKLYEAIHLKRGEFLAGLTVYDAPGFEAWQAQTSESVQRDLKRLLAAAAGEHERLGQREAGIAAGRQWLAEDGLDESAHRQVMRLLAGLGDRAGALHQFETCAALLEVELGLAPAAETAALADSIRRGEPLTIGTQSVAATPEETLPYLEVRKPVHDNLPRLATVFVGRHDDLAQIRRFLDSPETRLLTLIGPGGSGKTRLALQSGLGLVERRDLFPDGIWFVPLAPLRDTSEADRAMADALDMQFSTDQPPRRSLLHSLRRKRLLIILDNCEHLLPECAELASAILREAPGVSLLATSRARLNVQGEQIYPVAGMMLPLKAEDAAESDAVQLFLQAARRVQPVFGRAASDLAGAADICRLVMGMPLAIELAACWLDSLSAAEVAAEIGRSLDFLEADWPDVPERHRTMRAAFDSSWQMLSAEEQQRLSALAVFRGDFNREAAERVAATPLRTLRSLIHKSWLVKAPDGRYEMHELLRQYAAEKLAADGDASRATHQRHAHYYASLMGRHRDAIHTSQSAALGELSADLQQIRAAWFWLVEAADWSRLVADMMPVLFVLGQTRLGNWACLRMAKPLDEALQRERPGRPEQLAVRAFCLWSDDWQTVAGSGEFSWPELQQLESNRELLLWYLLFVIVAAHQAGGNSEGIRQLELAVGRLRQEKEPFLLPFALAWLGDLYFHAGQGGEARSHLEESLQLFRGLRPHFGMALAARKLALLIDEESDPARVSGLLDELGQVCEALDMAVPYQVVDRLATLAQARGELETGRALYRREQERAEERGDHAAVASSLGWESIWLGRLGRIEEALAARQRVLDMEEETAASTSLKGWNRLEMGEVFRLAGDLATAEGWYERALPYFESTDLVLGMAQIRRSQADVALARGDLEQALAGFERCLAPFQAGSEEWQVAYVKNGIGRCYLELGRLDESQEQFVDALRLARHEKGLAVLILAGLAEYLEFAGEPAAAVRLAVFVRDQALGWQSARERAAKVVERARVTLAPEAIAAASAAAAELTLKEAVAGWLAEPPDS